MDAHITLIISLHYANESTIKKVPVVGVSRKKDHKIEKLEEQFTDTFTNEGAALDDWYESNYTLEKYQSSLLEKYYQQLPRVTIPYTVLKYFYQKNLNAYPDSVDVLLHIENKKNIHVVRYYYPKNSSQFLPKWLKAT